MAVRVMLVAVLALAGACDRPGERGKQGPPRAHVAVADAALPAVDAATGAVPSALDAATGPAPGAELVVTASTPRPGTSSTITLDATLDFDLDFGGMQTVTSTRRTKTKQVEILAVDPDGAVHKRITYTKIDTNAVVDGERKKDPSPIRGKAYRVTWKDGIADVRLASGKPASAAEVAAVHGEEGVLQAPEVLGKALAGMRLVEGQAFEVPVAMLEKVVKGEYKPRRLVLTYRGKTPEGARIDADAALANDGEGVKMYVDVKAELLLDATGWCLSAKVTGQIRAELKGAVVGSGAGKATIVATPLR